MDNKIKYIIIVYGLPMLLILSHVITFILRISGVDQFDFKIHVLLANSEFMNLISVQNAISIILLAINLVLMIGIAYKIRIKEIYKKYWIFLLFSALLLYTPSNIAAFAKPLYFLLVLFYFSKNIKPVLIGLATMGGIILYQIFILLLKLGQIPAMGELTFYQSLVFNLDQYIAMTIIYIVIMTYRKKVKE